MEQGRQAAPPPSSMTNPSGAGEPHLGQLGSEDRATHRNALRNSMFVLLPQAA